MRFQFPGNNRPKLPPLTEEMRQTAERLRRDVQTIAGDIGERNVQRRYDAYMAAADYIEKMLEGAGLEPRRTAFDSRGKTVYNIVVDIQGAGAPIVIGAHYDTVSESPGANDNTSAVAVGLELARMAAKAPPGIALQFVFYANEESPYFMTEECGSYRHAHECREERRALTGMICLETIGFYTTKTGVQEYPQGLEPYFPPEGDFIAFVGNGASEPFLEKLLTGFREAALLPSEALSIPANLENLVVPDAWRSDHAAYWMTGYPAVMVTDTADFRYVHYHQPTDTPDQLCYEEMARLTLGLYGALRGFHTEASAEG